MLWVQGVHFGCSYLRGFRICFVLLLVAPLYVVGMSPPLKRLGVVSYNHDLRKCVAELTRGTAP